jgi:hypothetical protein
MNHWFSASGVLATVLLGSVSASGGNKIPDNVQMVLDQADQIELLSLDPRVGKDKVKDGFHGMQILGKTALKDADTRKKILTALKKGIEEKKEPVGTAAFYLRYALRATHEKTTVHLLISFDDSVIMVYVGENLEFVCTTASPQSAFDQVLRDAKVRISPKPDKK